MSPPDVPAPIPPAPTNGHAPRKAQPVVAITITLLDDGNTSLVGPVQDFELMVKMMGTALCMAADHAKRAAGAKLVQAAPAEALRILEGK